MKQRLGLIEWAIVSINGQRTARLNLRPFANTFELEPCVYIIRTSWSIYEKGLLHYSLVATEKRII